jgi:hypothetical protein
VILPAFKAGDPALASRMVGSTPTRFRQTSNLQRVALRIVFQSVLFQLKVNPQASPSRPAASRESSASRFSALCNVSVPHLFL